MAVDRCIPALSDAAGVHQHPCGGPEPAPGQHHHIPHEKTLPLRSGALLSQEGHS